MSTERESVEMTNGRNMHEWVLNAQDRLDKIVSQWSEYTPENNSPYPNGFRNEFDRNLRNFTYTVESSKTRSGVGIVETDNLTITIAEGIETKFLGLEVASNFKKGEYNARVYYMHYTINPYTNQSDYMVNGIETTQFKPGPGVKMLNPASFGAKYAEVILGLLEDI